MRFPKGLTVGALAVVLALAGSVVGASAQTNEAGFPFGAWRNPKNTVHIEIKPCGALACGYVIWANEKAEADAKRGGTPALIGSQLFKDFIPLGQDVWRGKVFVPDLKMTFSGTASPVETTGLKARGCLIANYICKSQIWRRITPAS